MEIIHLTHDFMARQRLRWASANADAQGGKITQEALFFKQENSTERHSVNTPQQPVAIVTGASSGIGLAVTQALLKRGWRVVGTSRTISSSKDLTPSPELVLVDGDVSKKETAIKVVDAALKHFGRIDLLVNNAGIFMPKAFTDYTEEDYNLVMNTNVASFFYMTQQVIPQMKKQNSGHVVSISGVNRAAPQPNFWPCCQNRRCRLRVRRWR